MGTQSLLFQPGMAGVDVSVRGQIRTPVASVELHDIHFRHMREFDFSRSRSFLDLALSRRPGTPRARYSDVAGHRTRSIGDVIFVPANMRIDGCWDSGTQSSICVEFDKQDDASDRAWTMAELDATLDIHNGFLRDAMIRLARELQTVNFQSTLMIEAICIEIAVTLGRHFRILRDCAIKRGSRLSVAQIHRIREMLDEAGPLPSVTRLARECSVSTRHFCRTFRMTTGRSLTEFAAEHRLERARRLLADKRRPIKQIAWECGFRTPAAFSAAFRRATGQQPRMYRAAMIG